MDLLGIGAFAQTPAYRLSGGERQRLVVARAVATDAHLVLASGQGVTAPGITVIDVPRALRPRPLPGPGDRVSAAGPVFTGSYGQRQIEAVEVAVAYEPDPAR